MEEVPQEVLRKCLSCRHLKSKRGLRCEVSKGRCFRKKVKAWRKDEAITPKTESPIKTNNTPKTEDSNWESFQETDGEE